MDRLISKQKVLKTIDNLKANFTCYDSVTLDEVASHVKAIPSAEPKTGYWIEEFNDLEGEVRFTCSSCGKYQLFETDYCYNCGAEMVEPQESEKEK